jgi:hypothetical protein
MLRYKKITKKSYITETFHIKFNCTCAHALGRGVEKSFESPSYVKHYCEKKPQNKKG